MIRAPFVFRETIATILADTPRQIAAAKSGMMRARQVLEAHIARDPFFLATFDPYTPNSNQQIILRMAHATRKAGVGPMAGVAGAIAWAGVEAMVDAGAVFGVIDNGGDIALLSDRPVRVGVHARCGSSFQPDRVCRPTAGKNTGYLHLIGNSWSVYFLWNGRCGYRFLI